MEVAQVAAEIAAILKAAYPAGAGPAPARPASPGWAAAAAELPATSSVSFGPFSANVEALRPDRAPRDARWVVQPSETGGASRLVLVSGGAVGGGTGPAAAVLASFAVLEPAALDGWPLAHWLDGVLEFGHAAYNELSRDSIRAAARGLAPWLAGAPGVAAAALPPGIPTPIELRVLSFVLAPVAAAAAQVPPLYAEYVAIKTGDSACLALYAADLNTYTRGVSLFYDFIDRIAPRAPAPAPPAASLSAAASQAAGDVLPASALAPRPTTLGSRAASPASGVTAVSADSAVPEASVAPIRDAVAELLLGLGRPPADGVARHASTATSAMASASTSVGGTTAAASTQGGERAHIGCFTYSLPAGWPRVVSPTPPRFEIATTAAVSDLSPAPRHALVCCEPIMLPAPPASFMALMHNVTRALHKNMTVLLAADAVVANDMFRGTPAPMGRSADARVYSREFIVASKASHRIEYRTYYATLSTVPTGRYPGATVCVHLIIGISFALRDLSETQKLIAQIVSSAQWEGPQSG